MFDIIGEHIFEVNWGEVRSRLPRIRRFGVLFSAAWQPVWQPLLVAGWGFIKFGNPFGNLFGNLFGNPFGNPFDNPFGNLGRDCLFGSR